MLYQRIIKIMCNTFLFCFADDHETLCGLRPGYVFDKGKWIFNTQLYIKTDKCTLLYRLCLYILTIKQPHLVSGDIISLVISYVFCYFAAIANGIIVAD